MQLQDIFIRYIFMKNNNITNKILIQPADLEKSAI